MMTPREIGALVLSEQFVMADAVKQVTPAEVAATIEHAERESQPLAVVELGFTHPDRRSERVKKIREALRLIGAKLKPEMAGDPARLWVDALVVSLSKWPARVVQLATADAVTEPFRFLNEVDARLHEMCDERNERAKGALLRLKRMQAEIDCALNPPQPQLEAPAEEPWDQERIDRANALFRRVGAHTRYKLGADGQPEPVEKEGLQATDM